MLQIKTSVFLNSNCFTYYIFKAESPFIVTRMTLLRQFFRGAESFLSSKRCTVICKSSYNAEYFFGSKIEIPSPPKRPLSAYMMFVKEKRKEVLRDNPSLSSTEQIKAVAEKWAHLTEDMKKPYELSARQSTLAYGEQHKKFYESLTEEQKNEIARLKSQKLESRRLLRIKKELRASGLPKHPNSAYVIFLQAEAKKKPAINHPTEFIKKVAELWKALPEESKKVYENLAQEEKVTFAKEINAWRTRMISEGNRKLVQAFEDLKGRGRQIDTEKSTARKRNVKEKSVKEVPESSKE